MSLFGRQRMDTRDIFFHSFEKQQRGQALEGIEIIIGRIITDHPEYHSVLQHRDRFSDRDYPPESGETNPFLHMGMHVAIEEQLSLDRPQGICAAYQRLLLQTADPHVAQHAVMECLGEMIWQAQRAGTVPDEQRYLECLQQHR